MKIEEYEALGVNIKVEIFDLDMRETIWPMSEMMMTREFGCQKKQLINITDDQIGKWFLNRYLD